MGIGKIVSVLAALMLCSSGAFARDVIHGYKTAFPIPLAMACSWDMDLIEETAATAAEEATADGLNWTFSPMTDISRTDTASHGASLHSYRHLPPPNRAKTFAPRKPDPQNNILRHKIVFNFSIASHSKIPFYLYRLFFHTATA